MNRLWRKKCSGATFSRCSSVVEEVGGKERHDFGSGSRLGRVNVEIVVMSNPTISSQLFFLGQEMQRWLLIATNSTGTNPILSSRGPSQTRVGKAMNTNSPTDVSWWGFSDSLVYASSFFHLFMQAIKVDEYFHIQHAYATPGDVFQKEEVLNGFPGNDTFIPSCRKTYECHLAYPVVSFNLIR